MVPHCRILKAIALAARSSSDESYVKDTLCEHYRVKFPVDLFAQDSFWFVEIHKQLPVEIRVAFETSQPALTGDYSSMFAAAEALGLPDLLHIAPLPGASCTNGPTVIVSPSIVAWRQHPAIRLALDCLLLCGIPFDVASSDMQKMYGSEFPVDELIKFDSLFTDRTQLGNWSAYSRCIPQDELAFKHRLTAEPKDFVRWKLGIPVHLDNETVLDRLMSEAYFTERLIKHEARGTDPHGLPSLGAADISRLKLERDTIFKCMDRKIKLKEAAGASSTAATDVQKILAGLKFVPDSTVMRTMDELTDG